MSMPPPVTSQRLRWTSSRQQLLRSLDTEHVSSTMQRMRGILMLGQCQA